MTIEFQAPPSGNGVYSDALAAAREVAADVNKDYLQVIAEPGRPDLGWMNTDEWAGPGQLPLLLALAATVRQNTDVHVVVGVGGSNQAARAVIEALEPQLHGPEVRWAGTNLSADYHVRLLGDLAGKQVHFTVIAKNFETLEPGIVFRLCREFARREYGTDYASHFTVIGSAGSSLEKLADDQHMTFLEFPANVGGRFTAMTAVGLFPMAVSGVDITALVQGGKEQQNEIARGGRAVVDYAATRLAWLRDGRQIEALAFFEPALARLGAWWVQLFAESEGKRGRGLFPMSLSYSEQLHSVGQYVQEGQRILAETFLDLAAPPAQLHLPADGLSDGFSYVEGADLNWINRTAFNATVAAHAKGGVPTSVLTAPALDARSFGQLFYFFEYSVALSGRLIEVYPFDQPGVEAYKALMFEALGRPF